VSDSTTEEYPILTHEANAESPAYEYLLHMHAFFSTLRAGGHLLSGSVFTTPTAATKKSGLTPARKSGCAAACGSSSASLWGGAAALAAR
jgi:hypothetical protein